MSKKPFFNHAIHFIPPGRSPAQAYRWIEDQVSAHDLPSLGRIKHQAFAAGFFGFHYIRATVENAPSLRKESLDRFMKLLNALQMDESFTNNLNISNIQTLSEFNKQIIKRVSLEMGDCFSPTIQWMVEFGFCLAITYSSLVTAVNCRSSEKLERYLDFIESRISNLILLAQKSEVPDKILDSLRKSKQTIHQDKTKPSIRKCFNYIGLAAESLLVTSEAIEFLE
jgi:hypothetical protein